MAIIGGYKVMDILAICQKLKILWHFEILTQELMGNLKCGISQWVNGLWQSKTDENLRLGYYSAYMYGTFDARFLEFGLGLFSALCKISDSTIFETLLLSTVFSRFLNLNFIQNSIIRGSEYSYYFFWLFENFVNTGPYGAGNFITLLLQFSFNCQLTL